MNIIQGDLIKLAEQGKFNIIVHGCNCFNTMGSGVAKQIKLSFTKAFDADQLTQKGDKEKLGTYSCSKQKNENVETGLIIINAYTQYNYLPRNIVNVDYSAIKSIFSGIYEQFNHDENYIAYPKIGAGLAGGDWSVISQIIDKQLKDMNHTLVEYVV